MRLYYWTRKFFNRLKCLIVRAVISDSQCDKGAEYDDSLELLDTKGRYMSCPRFAAKGLLNWKELKLCHGALLLSN